MFRSVPFVHHPVVRRLAWYGRQVGRQLNARLVLLVIEALLAIVAVSALIVSILEGGLNLDRYGASFYWAITSILGNGDSGFVTTPGGWLVYVVLIIVGVLMLGLITGVLIAVIIDFLLKEGQGMGASGYRNHIVVCGWNSTARDLVEELRGDEYPLKVVLIHDSERNPAGDAVYFVRGDPTEAEALERADIKAAHAAVVFPSSASNEADMTSILTVLAIDAVAPDVRIVVECNNPRHVEHFERAHADEVLVTSRLSAHLLARSAIYPGLTSLVTDIVSGGFGSELYRVTLPDKFLGLSVDEVSMKLRTEHRATLLAISRGTETHINPPTDFALQPGDDALVVAESLGSLLPLKIDRHRRHPIVHATPATEDAKAGA